MDTELISKRLTHLHRKSGHLGVSQRLWYSGQTHGEASHQVHLQPPQLVPGQPGEDGEQRHDYGVEEAALAACWLLQQRLIHVWKIEKKQGEKDPSVFKCLSFDSGTVEPFRTGSASSLGPSPRCHVWVAPSVSSVIGLTHSTQERSRTAPWLRWPVCNTKRQRRLIISHYGPFTGSHIDQHYCKRAGKKTFMSVAFEANPFLRWVMWCASALHDHYFFLLVVTQKSLHWLRAKMILL